MRRRRARALLGAALLGVLVAAPRARAEELASSARDLVVQGKRQMDTGRRLEALDSFRAARQALLARRPIDEEAADFLGLHLHNLGVRFNNDGEAARALECFLEALELQRAAPGLRDQRFREGLRQATLEVARFLSVSGKAAAALEAYTRLEAMAGGDARLTAEIAAGRGRIALAGEGDVAGRSAEAVGWLRRACELDPRSSPMRRELGGALSKLAASRARAGEIDEAAQAAFEAERAWREAVELDPGSPWARLELAEHLVQRRRYQEAASLLDQAERDLEILLAAGPGAAGAEALRRALGEARESRAVALYNLAVDAINRADFANVEGFLARACATGPSWNGTCRWLRETARLRERAFREAVAAHETALRADPSRAADLLALGDLHAHVGDYDKALAYYRRLESLRSEVPGLDDRIAAVIDPGGLAEQRRTINLPGAAAELRYFRSAAGVDLETAVRAAWLRVSTALGDAALARPVTITLYPNRRTFRERAGYRVGGLVKGNYAPGRISIFETPSQTVLEWVSVLTHELAHHGVEILSRAASPRWFSEGVARFIEGETAVVDRARLRRRMESAGLLPPRAMDEAMDRSWNDAEVILDLREQALLSVEEIVRRGGPGTLKEILAGLAAPGATFEETLRRAVGAGPEEIDAAVRAALGRGKLSGPAP